MSREAALLAGRRGLVLGVSGRDSIGFRAAAGMKRLGAEVAFTHRAQRAASAAELAAELACPAFELEASDEGSFERAFSGVAGRFERLDFLVHTLIHVPEGVLARPASAISAAEFASVMDVGVRSLLAACRYALPLLERSDAARVVTLLSPGSEHALPNYHAVGIAKGALAAAVRYLALELGPRRILCNAVNFSLVETAAARRVLGADIASQTRAYLEKRAPTRRATDYEDVVNAIAYLASPLCRNMTGESLTVDGGFSRSYF